MSKFPKVTKVTVEYAFEGKRYRVDFPDPDKIATITFSETDLNRLITQQEKDNQEVVKQRVLTPDQAWPTDKDGAKVFAVVSDSLGATPEPNGTSARALWWHSTACSWFHPEETDE